MMPAAFVFHVQDRTDRFDPNQTTCTRHRGTIHAQTICPNECDTSSSFRELSHRPARCLSTNPTQRVRRWHCIGQTPGATIRTTNEERASGFQTLLLALPHPRLEHILAA